MTQPTFTPGPWHSRRGQIRGGTNKVLARVLDLNDGMDCVTPAEAEANEALILAAPDILRSLHEMRAFIAVMCGRGPDAAIPETVNSPLGPPIKVGDIMRAASAALAKAEGRSC